MSELFKVLSDAEITEYTNQGKGSANCTYAQIMCNMFWPGIIKGVAYDDNTIGSLDCGTCSYWASQCGWTYIWGGSGTAWTGGCSTCTCH